MYTFIKKSHTIIIPNTPLLKEKSLLVKKTFSYNNLKKFIKLYLQITIKCICIYTLDNASAITFSFPFTCLMSRLYSCKIRLHLKTR